MCEQPLRRSTNEIIHREDVSYIDYHFVFAFKEVQKYNVANPNINHYQSKQMFIFLKKVNEIK